MTTLMDQPVVDLTRKGKTLKGTKTVIINPVSPEFVRASYCYPIYFLYAAEKERGTDVTLVEGFNATDFESLPKADRYWIACWSRTQVEQVKTLLKILPVEAEIKVFGYTPIVEAHDFPVMKLDTETTVLGLGAYPKYFDDFKEIFIDEPDMHLAAFPGKVYPVFTSFGCPLGCAFCAATIYQKDQLFVPLDIIKRNFELLKSQGRMNVHLTDEDFLLDHERANEVIKIIGDIGGFNLVSLSSRYSVWRYLKKYGTEPLVRAGFKLFEIGLETGSDVLGRDMGKGGLKACQELIQTSPIPVLWLTLTFFPGETLKTLRETGDFMKDWGLKPEQLVPRMQTNSTQGGLGQFFQPYEGTKQFDALGSQGEFLTTRPLRLLPSYIPNSFKACVVNTYRGVTPDEEFWYRLYRTSPPPAVVIGKTVDEAARSGHWKDRVDGYVSLAISAKLGVIA